MKALSAAGLQCRRGEREVFAGLDFSLRSGEALAVTGRNGSGKSSLLRLVAGLLPPAGGALTFRGGDLERSIGEQAHYLGHHDAMKPSLTVAENLRFWIDYLGGEGRADDALETVGLGSLAGLPSAYLSAGQRRRLSVARLAAIVRPIWLLDEPTAALDRAGQDMLAGVMRAHLAAGGLILAATHGPLGLEPMRELQLGAPR